MRRLGRWLARIAAGTALVLLVALLAGWLWLRTSLPTLDGERTLAGLQADVTVTRDERGVPYIEAGSAEDAYRALGFVHAQDRLAQMEFMRRFGTGRLSEVLGSGTLHLDRYMRTLGVGRLAEADFESLSAEVQDALVAYAAGVNAFLSSVGWALAPELELLLHEPEPWRPADSLIWGRLMALRLTGNWHGELLRARLAEWLPPERIAELWPMDVAARSRPAAPSAAPTADGASGSGLLDERLRPDPADGSNGWIIAGSRTETGAPILANDPHLGLTLPNIWYLARIDTPDLTLAGATTPGVPFHILGRNSEVAWGLTTTHGDASDIFVERVEGDRYATPDGLRPFLLREETIAVRFADPVVERVRETRHGPVISDVVPEAAAISTAGTVVALAHTGLLPGDVNAEGMYRINRARDVEQVLAAAAKLRSPQQNVLFATRAGQIGMQVAGLAPVRAGGDGFMPAPGWTGEFDWNGFLPFEEMPRELDPERHYIVNANNRPFEPGYPHFLARDWPEPYRAARIEEVIERDLPATALISGRLQMDVRSLGAMELRDLLLQTVSPSEANRAAVRLLDAWDGVMARDRPEPLIYYTWLRSVYGAVFADDLGELFHQWVGERPDALRRAIRGETTWCDNVTTEIIEACGPVLGRALDFALVRLREAYGEDLLNWRWGAVHRARFSNSLFGRIPVIGPYLDHVLETDGGNFTVNRGGMDLANRERPFRHVHGAGYRAVYDLSDLDRSQVMIAAGQSGNPLSRWYADLLVPWRDGEQFELAPPESPAHRLVLRPGGDSP